MSARDSELPPGLEWLEFLVKMGDQDDPTGWSLWVGGVVVALLFNAAILLLGAWLESRHDRKLLEMEAATAGVLIFAGRPPPDLMGVPHLVQAAIVMAPAPLGRLMLLIRRIIGGRVVTRQRDMQRTRRLALLRLRQQARGLGAGVLAGVEVCQIGVGRGRFALLATGTALIGPPPAPAPQVTESIGAEPPRRRREIVIALALLILAAAATVEMDYLVDTYFGNFWKRWVFHIKE
ncbi:MAG: heavy metal-binding domain-containing protein [Niveispirillum sp.]|uniref:heavy metal-binding domain-containing protein n=1 Tax=Niveispirillum sp. TaxID=1917217 RepID=UPI003BA5953F